MAAAQLEVRDLAISIGDQPVVSRAEFSVSAGRSLGIVGETGSGKTMTCRSLTGLLTRIGGRVISGQITFDGTDLLAISHKEWARLRGFRIGFVPQNSLNGLDPVMRVGRQIEETVRTLRPDDDATSLAKELLEDVQMIRIDEVMRAYPHELSGGMRQRVMIALAIAGRPEMLIADEPTTALDVVIEREILALLTELQAEHGMGLVIVSHDFNVIEAVADEIVVMYAGMTVERGSAAKVLDDPIHPYTKALLAARPVAAAAGRRLEDIMGQSPAPGNWPAGCRFAPRCPIAQLRCRERLPDMQQIGQGQAAACVRAKESVW